MYVYKKAETNFGRSCQRDAYYVYYSRRDSVYSFAKFTNDMYICTYLRAYVCTCINYTYVTRPAKINHVGTLIYFRNTNLKYSVPHNFSMPNSSCMHKIYTRCIVTSKQSYKYVRTC